MRFVVAGGAVAALVVAVPVSANPAAKTVNGSILIAAAPGICASQICSVDVTGKNLKALTSSDSLKTASLADCKAAPCTAWNGSFSHDGRRIAFTVNTSVAQEVWVMNADGTHMRPVTKSTSFKTVSQPSWSPNGKQIAFTGVGQNRGTSDPLIWSINANGTGLRLLTPPTDASLYASQAEWSPTGNKIAYVTSEGMDAAGLHANPSGIYIMNSDGTGSHRITPASDDPEQSVTWARNGKWLVFSMLAADWQSTNIATLERINADGTGMLPLTKPRTQYWDEGGWVSPDGTEIIFHRQHGNPVTGSGRTYIMNADGTHVRPLPLKGQPSSWGVAYPKS